MTPPKSSPRSRAWARWPSSRHAGTGNNPEPTTAPCTNSATVSSAASTRSSTSAASAHDTAEPSRSSGPPPHSPAPGSGSSYMRIPPSEAARRRIHETEALSHTGPSEGAAPSRCYRRIEDCARQRTRHQPSDPLSVRSGSREVKGGRQRVMHCPCGNSKILALGLCATCYRLKRQDEECSVAYGSGSGARRLSLSCL